MRAAAFPENYFVEANTCDKMCADDVPREGLFMHADPRTELVIDSKIEVVSNAAQGNAGQYR